MRDERAAKFLGMAVGTLGCLVVAGLLVPLRQDLVAANIALVFQLVVVLAAVTGGWQAGAATAVVATLSFDFFFTRPYLSLTIDSADDAETAVLLLVVGVCVGLIASRTRVARRAADASRTEISRIHRLAERVSRGDDAEDVILAAQAELSGLLDLRGCRFEAPPFDTPLSRLERSGVLSPAYHSETNVRHHRLTRDGFSLPDEGVELPVQSRGQSVGRFVLEPSPGSGASLEQRVVAVALADQVGAAIGSQ